jgi:hypothetical protein
MRPIVLHQMHLAFVLTTESSEVLRGHAAIPNSHSQTGTTRRNPHVPTPPSPFDIPLLYSEWCFSAQHLLANACGRPTTHRRPVYRHPSHSAAPHSTSAAAALYNDVRLVQSVSPWAFCCSISRAGYAHMRAVVTVLVFLVLI